MQKVDVRFRIGTKLYTFLSDINVEKGDYVIVETSLGQGFAKVESVKDYIKNEADDYKIIIRKATHNDVLQHEKNVEKEKQAIIETKELVEKLQLDMNVVNAEYSFDLSKVMIDFISENRVDFRDLVKELAAKLKTRIELRQIGTRDQAKMVGGIGICGRICCCASHLKDFEKVSIKMAKVQGLALNPTKISGSCGRLMCCLEYENEYYSEIYPKLPKLNAEVKTPDGVGSVVYINPLKQIVSVKIMAKDGSVAMKDFKIDEVSKFSQNNNTNNTNNNNSSNITNNNNNNNNKNNNNNNNISNNNLNKNNKDEKKK